MSSFIDLIVLLLPQHPSQKHVTKKSFQTFSKLFYSTNTTSRQYLNKRNKTIVMYLIATLCGFVGLSYAASPLYRLFCQVTGLGGTVKTGPVLLSLSLSLSLSHFLTLTLSNKM
jgi:cytochrome c oxidase assembly protein Cox11